MREKAEIISPGIFDCRNGVPAIEVLDDGTVLQGGYTIEELIEIYINDQSLILLFPILPKDKLADALVEKWKRLAGTYK